MLIAAHRLGMAETRPDRQRPRTLAVSTSVGSQNDVAVRTT